MTTNIPVVPEAATIFRASRRVIVGALSSWLGKEERVYVTYDFCWADATSEGRDRKKREERASIKSSEMP